MAAPPSTLLLFLFLFPLFSCAAAATKALDTVPANQTFKYVNQGEYGEYSNEYDATYRPMLIGTSPFQLMWYNTTPNQYYVALRMGTVRSESVRRWVWEANRGRPVGEGATLTFAADGNLVLAEADGTVAWSTNTANKGVVGLDVLANGNIVLYDRKRGFLWQSFEHHTDNLLVGQSLTLGKKLVSRRSLVDGSPGIYSFVAANGGPAMFVDASPKPLPYFNYSDLTLGYGQAKGAIKFECSSTNGGVSYELRLNGRVLAVTKYDSTLSFLRLEPDGDLAIYSYDDRVDYQAWQMTFTLFSPDNYLSACYKPSKCGGLGLCDEEMCVGCPTAKGVTGWSRAGCAAPPRRGTCRAGGNSSSYYKVVGVESFLSRYTAGEGAVKVGECRRRCNMDCNCLGFLYWEETSQCWLAPVLGTLNKVSSTSHVIYIKSS
ncbi:hypothetical protein Taro_027709 [Colocasia esculenta]|uniref:Bulb-type lectin domain-containing protein n=1 Tax=Colocasia esculenta TaxID=4460 RepID=A0A843VV30_COLES|nr:hypothetical protein [Colocasia esculenta]